MSKTIYEILEETNPSYKEKIIYEAFQSRKG